VADLADYVAKRDFTKTAEPKAKKGRGKGHSFVIQKHDARRLH
jgi:bifunctional non-homologous end joining protein LigD